MPDAPTSRQERGSDPQGDGHLRRRIYQTPPVRSAVKRQLRVRTIHALEVLEISGRDVLFRVDCDAGTYIRTLCVDIGDALAVGASMEDLRRTRSGNMTEDDAFTLQDIKDAYVEWKEEGDDAWLRASSSRSRSCSTRSPR